MTDINMLLFFLVYTVALVTMVKFMHHLTVTESNDSIGEQFDRESFQAVKRDFAERDAGWPEPAVSCLEQVFHAETLYFLSRRV